MFFGGREEEREGWGSGNDSKRIEAQLWDLSYIPLILSQSPPCYHSPRGEFIFYLFHFYLGLRLDIYIFICAAIEGSREVHHINCIDINSSPGALPLPLMRV